MLDVLRQALRRILGTPPADAPQDPYAPVRFPKSRRPSGRNSAVAVEEPEERSSIRAIASRQMVGHR